MSIVEPIAVLDVFASAICRVERLGHGLLRITFVSDRRSLYDNEPQQEVVARIVIAADSLVAARPAVDMAREHVEGAVGDIMVQRARH